MDNKTCTVCNIKNISTMFTANIQNAKTATSNEVENVTMIKKYKISIQQKIFYEKNSDKLVQKQNDYRNKKNTDYKELLISYVELKNKLKAKEENLSLNDSEKQ